MQVAIHGRPVWQRDGAHGAPDRDELSPPARGPQLRVAKAQSRVANKRSSRRKSALPRRDQMGHGDHENGCGRERRATIGEHDRRRRHRERDGKSRENSGFSCAAWSEIVFGAGWLQACALASARAARPEVVRGAALSVNTDHTITKGLVSNSLIRIHQEPTMH